MVNKMGRGSLGVKEVGLLYLRAQVESWGELGVGKINFDKVW